MNLQNKQNNFTIDKTMIAGFTLIFFNMIFFILDPILCYWGGWAFGVFAQLFVGEYIIEGFSYLNITIPYDHIPKICGALTIFGWCIRGRSHINTDKK